MASYLPSIAALGYTSSTYMLKWQLPRSESLGPFDIPVTPLPSGPLRSSALRRAARDDGRRRPKLTVRTACATTHPSTRGGVAEPRECLSRAR